MRLDRVILRVTDLDESVEFWTDTVGLSLSGKAGAFAFLSAGDREVQLTLNQVEARPDDASLTEIVFEVADIHGEHAAMLERGVPFEIEPRPVTSDGERELWAAHFRDPDGHLASVVGWVGES
jgi:catechol 2,3-dioxygenase-like lactoylglutathione lyase family enzyme